MSRRGWAVVALGGWVGLIGVGTVWGRELSELAGGWAELVVGAGLGGGGLWALWRYRHGGWREWGAVVVAGGVMALLWMVQEVGIERVHLVLYGGLGLVGWWGAREWGLARAGLWAGGLCVLVGAVDELVQWMMPSRVGDLKDVVTNAVAGMAVAWCAQVVGGKVPSGYGVE